ncbi:MAG: hypothetical protein Q3998_03075 [Porphyromonas sp.]|nr:hypothetical protein [Porphyromonas sp.]
MKRKVILIALIASLALLFSGCAMMRAYRDLRHLPPGLTKQEVEHRLYPIRGMFENQEFYRDKNGDMIEVLTYRDDSGQAPYNVSYIHLIFRNNILVEKQVSHPGMYMPRRPIPPGYPRRR